MKISKPKIKVKAPKVKVPVPKAISKAVSNIQKNVGTAATTALKSGGDFATQMAQSVGKGAQGTLGSAGDIAQSLVKGDIKGVASGGLGAVQNIKDATKGIYGAYGNLATDALKVTGEATGSEELTEASENIKREGNKALNQYGDIAMDIGANITTGGAYGIGKGALEATAEGGLSTKTLTDPRILAAAGSAAGLNPALAQQLSGVTSKDGIKNLAQGQVKDLALETVASKYGLDPSLTKTVGSLGLGAVTGDMKNAVIEAGAEMAGLSPDQTDIAKAGVSALSGDKSGMVSKLASTAGIQKDAANLLGSVAGGKDLKTSALQAAGSYAGLDRGKMDLAKKGLSALSGDRRQLLKSLTPQMGDIQKFAMSKAGIDPNQLTKGLKSKLPENLKKMLPKLKMDQFKNFLPQKQQSQIEEPSMDMQQEQQMIPDQDMQQMPVMEPQMDEQMASFVPSSKIITEAMPKSFDMTEIPQTLETPKLKSRFNRSSKFNKLRERFTKPAGFIKKRQKT